MITESCEGDASKVSIWTTAHLPLPKPHINSNSLPVDCCWVTGRVAAQFCQILTQLLCGPKSSLEYFLTIAVAKGMLSIKEETNAETHKMIIIAIPSW